MSIKRSALVSLALLFIAGTALVGCELQLPTADPFEREEQVLQTIEGEVFSFDISVATQATHRLEKEGRLVALLASDIIPLQKFENREVKLQGTYKTEKMREIFWVEGIELLALTEEEEQDMTEERFLAKDFTFLFPANWEYSTAPDGTAYFAEKGDPAKRVFLKFSVSELTREDRKLDPNVLIANLSGHKKSSNDDLKREEQDIALFSNVNRDRKYSFYFVTQFEDFEKKKQFFALLNSFIEGEEAVQTQKEEDLRIQAQKILEKVKEEEERQKLEAIQAEFEEEEIVEAQTEEEGLFSKIIDKISQTEEDVPEEELIEEIVEEKRLEEEKEKWAFDDLIDGRAYPYTSKGLRFSMKIPFGFWFVNYGAVGDTLGTIGIANNELGGLADADFVLEVIEATGGVDALSQETLEDGRIVIKFPREGFENSHFQLVGPAEFRDAMLSIWATVSYQ